MKYAVCSQMGISDMMWRYLPPILVQFFIVAVNRNLRENFSDFKRLACANKYWEPAKSYRHRNIVFNKHRRPNALLRGKTGCWMLSSGCETALEFVIVIVGIAFYLCEKRKAINKRILKRILYRSARYSSDFLHHVLFKIKTTRVRLCLGQLSRNVPRTVHCNKPCCVHSPVIVTQLCLCFYTTWPDLDPFDLKSRKRIRVDLSTDSNTLRIRSVSHCCYFKFFMHKAELAFNYRTLHSSTDIYRLTILVHFKF